MKLLCKIIVIISLLNGAQASKKNILFVMADDLRPELSNYVDSTNFPDFFKDIYTPNIDAFSKTAFVAKRPYVQQAVCAPSRASLLTGRRPDTTNVYTLSDHFRATVGSDVQTIPQYFKDVHQYHTVGMGKIFHPGEMNNNDDINYSWSESYYHPANKATWSRKTKSWEAVDTEDLPDNYLLANAITKLEELKDSDDPFFMAVGFYKPHLPFIFPQKYLSHYPEDDISPPAHQSAPSDFPEFAWFVYQELLAYDDMASYNGSLGTVLPADVVLNLRRAYYASVSYIDDLFGQLMAALVEKDLYDNTVVLFCGDHGWQLGEHGEWTKNNNFDLSLRSPLMIRVPGTTDLDDGGVVTDSIVEFVDIFPTLVDVSGVEDNNYGQCSNDGDLVTPACHEGRSLLPLINDPNAAWTNAAFSQYPGVKDRTSLMGYTVRTDQFRYTLWVQFNKRTGTPIYKRVFGEELYDHFVDPGETRNVADDASYAANKRVHKTMVRTGWRSVFSSTKKTFTNKKDDNITSKKISLLKLLKQFYED